MTEPQRHYERTHETIGQSRLQVTATTFSRGGEPASAVTLMVAVGEGFFTQLDNGGGAATGLLSSTEARAVATWLNQAADAADAAAPGLFD
jgi:hypothetical protein